jgi:Calx-beta domain
VVLVSYAVTGGSATQGVDYTGGAGVLRFNAGEMSQSFSLSIVQDNIVSQRLCRCDVDVCRRLVAGGDCREMIDGTPLLS